MKTKPHLAITIVTYFLAILSVAAGIPKIMQMPQELEFLRSIGISAEGVSLLGVLQLSGGLLMLWSRTRFSGTLIVMAALMVSSIAIFAGGNRSFGFISLLPFFLGFIVIRNLLKGRERSDT